MSNTYYPICNTPEPEPFHLKETSLGTYKRLRLITLRYSSATAEHKLAIIEEFKLSEAEITKEYGVEDYFKLIFSNLFLEAGKFKNVDPENLNMGVINRALQDFFTMLKGS